MDLMGSKLGGSSKALPGGSSGQSDLVSQHVFSFSIEVFSALIDDLEVTGILLFASALYQETTHRLFDEVRTTGIVRTQAINGTQKFFRQEYDCPGPTRHICHCLMKHLSIPHARHSRHCGLCRGIIPHSVQAAISTGRKRHEGEARASRLRRVARRWQCLMVTQGGSDFNLSGGTPPCYADYGFC